MKDEILLAVSGGIAAYKALDVITGLQASNYYVSCMATNNAFNFVTKNALEVLSDNFIEDIKNKPVHIQATDVDLKAFIIVPATANIIGKIVAGIADDLVTNTVLALNGSIPKIICPAMNTRMWFNPVVQRNIKSLKELGWYTILPIEGVLACGHKGIGKLNKPRNIVNQIVKIIKEPSSYLTFS